MKQEISNEKYKQVSAFYTMAYDDYIASRFLLNNDYILQGAILASTSIEKYFKGLLLACKPEITKVPKVHLDRIENLKSQFSKTMHEDIFNLFDVKFLEELSIVYKFRYYDNFSKPTSIGFLVNQFLGELDYIVYIFNNAITRYRGDALQPTKYWNNVKEFNKDLYQSNMIFNKVDKNDFMNRETKGFSFYINPKTLSPISLATKAFIKPGTEVSFKTKSGDTKLMLPKYSGSIFKLILNDKNDT